MLKKLIFGKPVSAVLPMLVCAGIGLTPVSAYASMVGLPDVGKPAGGNGSPGYMPGNPGTGYGRPDHLPPVNPPIDTPAFYKGLVNAPDDMPASVPSHTLPGSGIGQAVVPVPAALWLFGSGLLGLIGIARRKKVV